VLLGLPYASEIDAWSLGCILAELYLGLPLFAGTSELSQLRLISELGPFPPHMLLAGTKVRRFFDVDGLSFTLKTDAQFAAENNVPIRKPNRRYFEFSSLEQLVMRYPQPATVRRPIVFLLCF
jgi:dual specificity protein kinase YAK1